MRLEDLSDKARLELKQRLLMEWNDEDGEGTSYFELEAADEYVSDDALEEEYGAVEFTEDDFGYPCGRMKISVVVENPDGGRRIGLYGDDGEFCGVGIGAMRFGDEDKARRVVQRLLAGEEWPGVSVVSAEIIAMD